MRITKLYLQAVFCEVIFSTLASTLFHIEEDLPVYVEKGHDASIKIKINFKGAVDILTRAKSGKVDKQIFKGPTSSIFKIKNVAQEEVYELVAQTIEDPIVAQALEVEVKIFEPVRITKTTPTLVTLGLKAGAGTDVPCYTNGTGNIHVEWYKVGNPSIRLSNQSVIVLKNTAEKNIGRYLCKAWNRLGKKVFKDSKEVTVRAHPGPPSILNVESNECWTGVQFTWQPDILSVGYPHRFIFRYEEDGNHRTYNISITPKGGGQQMKTVTALPEPSKTYEMTVTDCSGDCLSSKPFRFSNGIDLPPKVEATVEQFPSNNTCSVSWHDLGSTASVENYTVFLQVAYNYPTQADPPKQEKADVVTGERYSFSPRPNRVYKSEVEANNCAGAGARSPAIGSCVTKRAAPGIIESPEYTDQKIEGGRSGIVVHGADESNGSISCYFVIARKIDLPVTSNNETSFDKEKLDQALKITNLQDNRDMSKQYIAAALPRSHLVEKQHLVLGNGTTTRCDINAEPRKNLPKNPSGTVYVGRNFPLEDGGKYKIFVVSVTPDDGIYHFRSSEAIVIPPEMEPSRLLAIILPVFVCVLIVILFIVIIFVLRKRRGKKPVGENDQNNRADEEALANHGDEQKDAVGTERNLVSAASGQDARFDPNVYENVRKEGNAPEDNDNQENAYESAECSETETSKKEKNKKEGIYLAPIKRPNSAGKLPLEAQRLGEVLYENLQPSSSSNTDAADPLYDNVDSTRDSRAVTANF